MASSIIFNRALSASAVILLSAGAISPAVAIEASPVPEATAPVSATAATSDASVDIDEYTVFYLSPYQEDETSNVWTVNPGFNWKSEGGDYGNPGGITFELVSASPELNATMVGDTGKINVAPSQKLDLNQKYSFTVLVKSSTGASATLEVPFETQALYPEALANQYDPQYSKDSLNVDHTWTGETLQLKDDSMMKDISGVTVTSDNGDITGTVDQETGALTLKHQNPNWNWDIDDRLVVTFTYTDGSTDQDYVSVHWDAGKTIAEQMEPMYSGDAANPVETGKTYSAAPVWLDKFDGTEVSGPTGGVKASLVTSDPALNATIDEATGEVSFHFDTLPSESTEYKFKVRFTYADGSTEDVEFSYNVTVANEKPTVDEESQAAWVEFGYDYLKNMKPGQEYRAEPVFWTGRMQPNYFTPKDATFKLSAENSGLKSINIDEKTGVLTFEFPEDAPADFSTTVKVTVRFSDGSELQTPVVLATNSEIGADALPVDHSDPLGMNEETPAPISTEEPTAPVVAQPEATQQPEIQETPVSEAPATQAPATDKSINNTAPVADTSSQPAVQNLVVATGNEAAVSATQPVVQQSTVSDSQTELAQTGANHALAVFFAGLVALGAGSAMVLRRKH